MKQRGPRLQKIMRIKEEWSPFSQDFQDSPLHFLVTGRLGFNWEEAEVENDKGEIVKEVSRGGSKIKAEGDFGHEPDLEIEMSAVEDPDFLRWEKVKGKNRRTFKSQMIHVATLKKSRVWALNGQAFSWKDQPGYKLGYYQRVAECFKPHFESINIGGSHNVMQPTENSSILFTPGIGTVECRVPDQAHHRPRKMGCDDGHDRGRPNERKHPLALDHRRLDHRNQIAHGV